MAAAKSAPADDDMEDDNKVEEITDEEAARLEAEANTEDKPEVN